MSQTRTVHVRVNDASIKRPTAVRIRISGPDGVYYPPLGRAPDFPVGRNEDVGGHVYLGGKRYTYIDGSAEFSIPTEVPLSVEVTKGPAYTPIRASVTLGPGQLTLRFDIHPWADGPWADLIATDSRCHFLSPHSARLEAAAEGLDLVNLLVTVQDYPSPDGHMYRVVPNLTAFSGQTAALDGVNVNTLNVHPALGRVGLLNSHRPVFPLTFGYTDETDDWSLADWCDQCHRKGGLVVWSDAYRPDAGIPGGEVLVDAILGKVDAIEIDAHDRTVPILPKWYQLLNAGIRLALVGGSRKDSNRVALGGVRTATPRTGTNSYSEWVDHVKAGRTIATNGPGLILEVDGERFVTQVTRERSSLVRLRAAGASMVPFDRLEVIANGSVIATTSATDTEGWTATLELDHPIEAGGWLAARCIGLGKSELYPHIPVFAHTSPVWVTVPGHPAQPNLAALEAIRREVEGVRHWVESVGRFTQPRRKEHLLALCDATAARLTGPT